MLYQGNVSGGLTDSADFNGLVYFSNFFDFDKIFNWKGASLLLRIDGGWGAGIDDAVGSLTNINTLAGGAVPSDSAEYEWSNPFRGNSPWLFAAEAGTVLAVGPDGKPGHYYAGIWGSAGPKPSRTARVSRRPSKECLSCTTAAASIPG